MCIRADSLKSRPSTHNYRVDTNTNEYGRFVVFSAGWIFLSLHSLGSSSTCMFNKMFRQSPDKFKPQHTTWIVRRGQHHFYEFEWLVLHVHNSTSALSAHANKHILEQTRFFFPFRCRCWFPSRFSNIAGYIIRYSRILWGVLIWAQIQMLKHTPPPHHTKL